MSNECELLLEKLGFYPPASRDSTLGWVVRLYGEIRANPHMPPAKLREVLRAKYEILRKTMNAQIDERLRVLGESAPPGEEGE